MNLLSIIYIMMKAICYVTPENKVNEKEMPSVLRLFIWKEKGIYDFSLECV